MGESRLTRTKIDFEALDEVGFQRLGAALEIDSFGFNLVTLRPGQRNRVHIHERQEEVYLVIEGELTLVVDGEDVVLGRHEIARVPPSVRRQLTNPGKDPVVLLAIGGFGEHQRWDALAWTTWDEPGGGKHPKDVPLPDDLPT